MKTDLIIMAIAAGGVLLTAIKWAFLPFLPHRRLPRHRVRHLRIRLHLRLHPGPGHATIAELWLRWGRLAVFRRSARARRSLTFWQRALSPASAYSILIGRAHYRHALRLPLEEHAVVESPPREGKTGWLAGVVLPYPGAVVSTTTKHDVFELTSGIRADRGPVHVFNPQNIGGVPSTFRWNPLDGCLDPATAIRRADAFAHSVSQKGVEDASFWAAKASDYLRAYFHAGAAAGLDLTCVARWVTGAGATEAEDILAAIPGSEQWAGQLAELRGEAEKTAQTIRMTMSRALAFLADPALAACIQPGPGGSLDLEDFLRRSGTLYLIAETRGEDSPVAPLFACLASELHYTAALTGSRMPAGRLDPPLLLALDEVTQICPVPVPSWLADSGGKGIQIITVAHGEAQLRSRWGADGARIIMDTSGTKIWLPGISDTATLDAASTLCGTTAMKEHRGIRLGRGDYYDVCSRHPVMTPEMIRQLPAGRALVIRGGCSPVIARLPMCWNDRRYRRARRHGRATAHLAPALEPDPGDGDGEPAAPPAPTWPHLPSTGTTPPLPPPGTGTGPIARYPWDDDNDEEQE
jgi:type IV secretion system protein VirD4